MAMYTTASGGLTTNPAKAVSTSTKTSTPTTTTTKTTTSPTFSTDTGLYISIDDINKPAEETTIYRRTTEGTLAPSGEQLIPIASSSSGGTRYGTTYSPTYTTPSSTPTPYTSATVMSTDSSQVVAEKVSAQTGMALGKDTKTGLYTLDRTPWVMKDTPAGIYLGSDTYTGGVKENVALGNLPKDTKIPRSYTPPTTKTAQTGLSSSGLIQKEESVGFTPASPYGYSFQEGDKYGVVQYEYAEQPKATPTPYTIKEIGKSYLKQTIDFGEKVLVGGGQTIERFKSQAFGGKMFTEKPKSFTEEEITFGIVATTTALSLASPTLGKATYSLATGWAIGETTAGIVKRDVKTTAEGLVLLTPAIYQTGKKLYGKYDTYFRSEMAKNLNEGLAKSKQLIIADKRELATISKQLATDIRVTPIENIKGVSFSKIKSGQLTTRGGVKIIEGDPLFIKPKDLPVYDYIRVDVASKQFRVIPNKQTGLIVSGTNPDLQIGTTQYSSKYFNPQRFGELFSGKGGGFKTIQQVNFRDAVAFEQINAKVTGVQFATTRDIMPKSFYKGSGKATPQREQLGQILQVGYQPKLSYTPLKSSFVSVPKNFKIQIIDTSTGKGFSLSSVEGKAQVRSLFTQRTEVKTQSGTLIKEQVVEQVQKPVYIVKEFVPRARTRAKTKTKPISIFKPVQETQTKTNIFTERKQVFKQPQKSFQETLQGNKPAIAESTSFRPINIVKPVSSQKVGSALQQNTKQSFKQMPKQKTDSATSQGMQLRTATTSAMAQETAQDLVSLNTMGSFTKQKLVKETPRERLKLPNLNFGKSFSGKSFTTKRIKQPKAYTPTVFAIQKQIKGKRSKLGELSGLGVRPIAR